MNVNKEKLEKILNQPGKSVEDIRKEIILALRNSLNTNNLTTNPLFKEYLDKCQDKGLLSETILTVLQQEEKLAGNYRFLDPGTSTPSTPSKPRI